MYQDIIVDKIRQERTQHLAKFGGSLAAACKDIASKRADLERSGWVFQSLNDLPSAKQATAKATNSGI